VTDAKLTTEVKRLNSRIAALEKLLERIIRQKPVSERQLDRALKKHSLDGRRAH
jgi:hypothetical protein